MLSRVWLLWLLTGLLIAGYPIVSFVYWPQVLHAGVLAPESDSIGIPMFGSIFVALLISPLVVALTLGCSHRYNRSTRILAWRGDRPWRSTLATGLFGGSAGWLAIMELSDLSAEWPWYEYLWTGYGALVIVWLLWLRAAIIDRLDRVPVDPEIFS